MYSPAPQSLRPSRSPLEEDPFAANALPQSSTSSTSALLKGARPIDTQSSKYASAAFSLPSPISPGDSSFSSWPSSSPSSSYSSSPATSFDVTMTDAYSTPPTSRVLPTVAKLPTSSRKNVTSRQQLSSKAPLLPTPIHTSHFLMPEGPLTPPLTPPYTHASIDAISFSPPTPEPIVEFPTASAEILYNYPLHKLFAREYTLHEELGCGGFGFVVRAERNYDGLSVAVKFIQREKIPPHGWARARQWQAFRGLCGPIDESGARMIPMEAYVLSAIHHEGVVAFIDLFEDETYFYLIMEHHGSPWSKTQPPPPPPPSRPALAPALSFTALPTRQVETPVSSPILASASLPSPQLSPPRPVPMARRSSCDLFECIEQHSRFSEDVARYVFAQIVEVVYALGQMGVCHRDIKDENIVISNDLKVKLIDFGSAVIFDPRAPPPVYDRFYGTVAFASAEILQNRKYQAPSSEVWSLGVLLSILVTGECPFVDKNAAAIGRMSPPRVGLGFDVENLMRACLEVDISKRITIAEMRRHRWLRGALRSRPQ